MSDREYHAMQRANAAENAAVQRVGRLPKPYSVRDLMRQAVEIAITRTIRACEAAEGFEPGESDWSVVPPKAQTIVEEVFRRREKEGR